MSEPPERPRGHSPRRNGPRGTARRRGLPEGAILVVPGDERALYRLVRGDGPSASDFRSRREMGRARQDDEAAVLHAGVSMFAQLSQALRVARRYPKVVAKVVLPKGHAVNMAKTRGPGHYTVWGDPEKMASRSTVVLHQPEP